MNEQDRWTASAVEVQSDGNVTKSIVGIVKGRDLHLTNSGAGFVASDGDLSITNGGCGPVLAPVLPASRSPCCPAWFVAGGEAEAMRRTRRRAPRRRRRERPDTWTFRWCQGAAAVCRTPTR